MPYISDPLLRCLDDRLTPFYMQNDEFDANIRHIPPLVEPPFDEQNDFIPYVGNGIFGLEIHENGHLNVKSGRALTLPLYFRPIVSISTKNREFKEATVVEYTTGIVHRFVLHSLLEKLPYMQFFFLLFKYRFQCFADNFFVAYQYYAHRNMPSVLVQEIQITNMNSHQIEVDLILPRISESDWPMADVQKIK